MRSMNRTATVRNLIRGASSPAVKQAATVGGAIASGFSHLGNASEMMGTSLGYVPGSISRKLHNLSTEPGRLGRAVQTIEEAERIKRDTQDLLTRARIELARRKSQESLAGKYLRSGMMG